MAQHIHIYTDDNWEESKHPWSSNGEFGHQSTKEHPDHELRPTISEMQSHYYEQTGEPATREQAIRWYNSLSKSETERIRNQLKRVQVESDSLIQK